MSTTTPLTDSINALTTYANEVTGGSDTTLSDAVATLASGYGSGGSDFDLFQYIKTISANMFRDSGAVLPEGYELRLRNLTSVNTYWLYGLQITNEATVTFDNNPTSLDSCFYGFNSGGTAGKLILNVDTSNVTNFGNFLRDCVMREIEGEIDFTSATNVGNFAYASPDIEEIRFAQNTLSITMPSRAITVLSNLSDASIVSIANSLNPNVSGLSLYLHSTPKARCSTLMGTVANGVFTADENGTVTLADFIANTKGWTLA